MSKKKRKSEIQIKKSTLWKGATIVLFFIVLFIIFQSPNYENTESDDENHGTYFYDGKYYNSYEEYLQAKNYTESETNDVESVKDEIKQTIVWVKYDVTIKNVDGSYFESGETGSGVIVANEDNELTIYTNRHVIDCEYNDMNCFQRISESFQVRTQDGKLHDVDRVSFSESDIDLAILKIKTSDAKSYDFAYYTDEFEINEKVIAVGYPSYAQNVVEFSISEGRITDIKDVLSQSTGDNFRTIESDAYTYFGSSGGGLFDEQGNLIGINTWISGTQTSIAIDFNSIKEQSFIYCSSGSYFTNGECHEYESELSCQKGYVLGDDDLCHEACGSPTTYCETGQCFNGECVSCEEGYILGNDGYCHEPCGSPTTYCEEGSYCYNNDCVSCPTGYYLGVDGNCYPN